MGVHKYLRNSWKNPSDELKDILRERLIKWRKEKAVTKIEKPTRLDRARSLGYRAKKGFVVVRVRLPRGGRKRARPLKHGRRSKRATHMKILSKSYQVVAEERAAKKHPNLEVLNSYYVEKDGKHYWYEIILVDPTRPEIWKDKTIKWIVTERGRVYRGLTSAGKKSRGLTKKGKGAEKIRPSLKANLRRSK